MEIKEMSVEELEARKAAIATEVEAEGADLDALEAEVRAINAELEARAEAEAKKVEIRKAVADGEGKVVEKTPDKIMEERKMTQNVEYRNKPEYIEAYGEYLKTGDKVSFRSATALLTENVSGGEIAVPDFVYDIIKTAWDKNEILSLVTKEEIKGNLKISFEISGEDAVIHTEGSGAVDEEELNEGIIKLVPAMVKKWKSFSKEVMAMRGEAFVRYIYDEITYRVFKKLADALIGKIALLPQTADADDVSAAAITAAPALGTVADAIAHLSDEAVNPTIVMNKLTWSAFKSAQYAGQFSVDPFEGLRVVFNNSLPAYSAASAGDVYMIVGDFKEGALVNFPDGEDIKFTFDIYSRKKEDLVEVLGEVYTAFEAVADKAFTLIKKGV